MDIKVPRKFKKDSIPTNQTTSASNSTTGPTILPQDNHSRPSQPNAHTNPNSHESPSHAGSAWSLLRIIENLGPYEPPGSDEICRIIANFLNNIRTPDAATPTLEDLKEFLAATMALRFERVTVDEYLSYTLEKGSISNLDKQRVVDLLPPKPQIVKFGELRVSLQNYFAIDLKPLYSVLCKLVDRLYDRLVELGVLLEDTLPNNNDLPQPSRSHAPKTESKGDQLEKSYPNIRENSNGSSNLNNNSSNPAPPPQNYNANPLRFPNSNEKRLNTNTKSSLNALSPPCRQDWPNKTRGLSPDLNSETKFREKFSPPQMRRAMSNSTSDIIADTGVPYRPSRTYGVEANAKRQVRSNTSSSAGSWRANAGGGSPVMNSRSPPSSAHSTKSMKRDYPSDEYGCSTPIHPSSRVSPAEYFRDGRARREARVDSTHVADETENGLHRKGTSDAAVNSICSGKKRVGEKLTKSYKGLGVKTTWFCKKTNAWITTFELDVDDFSSDEDESTEQAANVTEDGRRTIMSTKKVVYDPTIWGGFDEARTAAENFEFKIDKGVQIQSIGDAPLENNKTAAPSGVKPPLKPVKRSRRNSASEFMSKIPSISGWKPPLEWNPFSHCGSCSCGDKSGLPIHCRTCMCSSDSSRPVVQFKRVTIKNVPDIAENCISGHCTTEKSPWQRSFSTLLQVDY